VLERIGTLQGTEAKREASIATIEALSHRGIKSLKIKNPAGVLNERFNV
jgi:hypothetical protein